MTLYKPAITEGAPDIRPTPGPRQHRARWTGQPADQPMPTTLTKPASTGRPFAQYLPAPAQTRARLMRRQIAGIDAGKGVALLAMITVQALPVLTHAPGQAPWVWASFAGAAMALFCVLTGAGLAETIDTCQQYPHRSFKRTVVNVVVRAMLLFGIGLAVNSLVDLKTADILVYFAAMYVLAIPLYMLRGGHLLVMSPVLIVITPLLVYWFDRQAQSNSAYVNPVFDHVLTDPLGVVTTLLFTGAFPALTWLSYLCLGLAIGRLKLLRPGAPLLLMTLGACIAVGAKLVSGVVFGTAPSAASSFSLAISGGLCLVVIGVCLSLIRNAPGLLRPISALGSMPLTIYVTHLVLASMIGDHINAWAFVVVEICFLLSWATIWRALFEQGPLEFVVVKCAGSMSRLIIAVR